MPISPYGGALVERWVADNEGSELIAQAGELVSIDVDATTAADLELLGNGGLSPLGGFMGQAELHSVLQDMRLAGGLPWTIPIVAGVDGQTGGQLSEGQTVALRSAQGRLLALLELEEIYAHDARAHAQGVYGTDSPDHPGVRRVLELGDVLLGGPVSVLPLPVERDFADHHLTPRQTREEFRRRGWETVVAFQTRNPIHRAHEYLMKCALESTDGLLLHPIVGHTKADDLSPEVRIKSYDVLLANYFNPDRSMLSLFPAAMRYAGPREAVFHAICRRNYGCTHFIVGRDHAGARSPDGTPYYDPLDAQRIFSRFDEGELGMHLFFYEHSFYCRTCRAIVTEKTAPATPETRFALSGTNVRELLRIGKRPPAEITRPEVADVLIEALKVEQRARDAAAGEGI